jgi:tetratricopeptide (TPR) repeat protein
MRSDLLRLLAAAAVPVLCVAQTALKVDTATVSCASLLASARREFANQNYAAAVSAFQRAAAQCPPSADILVELARAHLMAAEFRDCRAVADRATAIDRRNATALLLKGQAAYFLGEDKEAAQALLSAISIEPRREDTVYSLARIYCQQSRIDDAIAQFRKVVELNPKSFKAYDNLGLCFQAKDEEELAIRHFLKALDLIQTEQPVYAWPYVNLAALMLKRNEYRRAFDLASEAAHRDPGLSKAFFLAGKALAKLNSLDSSVKWLKRAIELDPEYPEALYWLFKVQREQGRTEEAHAWAKAFQEARKKRREDPR